MLLLFPSVTALSLPRSGWGLDPFPANPYGQLSACIQPNSQSACCWIVGGNWRQLQLAGKQLILHTQGEHPHSVMEAVKSTTVSVKQKSYKNEILLLFFM